LGNNTSKKAFVEKLKQIMRILIKTCKGETYVLHRKQHVTTRSSYKTIDFYKMFSELKSTGEKTT